jgi:hypothetical protein
VNGPLVLILVTSAMITCEDLHPLGSFQHRPLDDGRWR